ncbi:hypothetical protein PG990_010752 [Apiospora arundinis]
MASNLPVKLGFWTDHNWSEAVDNTTFLLTVSAPWGSAWKISIGVALGLGWPCARIILVRSCAWVRYIARNCPLRLCGGAVGEMPSSNTVLSNSADCGFWELQRNVDSRIQDKDDLIQAEKEMRASQYAKNCYGEQPIHYTAQCEPFQAREIAHSMEKVNSCKDFLSIGALRPMQLVPMNQHHQAANTMPGSQIPDLSRARDTYMTVIFVSSCRIFYNGRCEDPVFPADRDVFPIGRPSRKYYNSDPRPRVLVAIDEMRICAKDNKICDSPDELPKGISLELRSAYDMARTIFKRTSTYNSLRYRLGSALLAADGISDFESRQLSNEQWIIESQALFRTSLARLQFNTMDFAMGDRPRVLHEKAYNNTTPDWARHENCTPYKFSLPGQYSNIQVAQFGFLLIPIALFIGSRKVGLPSQDLPFPGSWIFFDSVLYHILFVASLIGRGLWYVVLVTKRKIQEIGRLY